MPMITDQAVCIRRWDWSETSQTVSLFSREHGIFRGIAKGARREKGSFGGGLEVLTRGLIVASLNPGKDLATLTEWRLEELFPAVRMRLNVNRAALYCADLVHHMLTDHDPHPTLYDALVQTLRAFNATEAPDMRLLGFQWMMLKETGYQPQLLRDAETGTELPGDSDVLGFSAGAGGVVRDTGASDRWRVRRETVDLLRSLASNSDDTSRITEPAVVARASRLLAVYIRDILGFESAATRWAFPDA